VLIGTFVLALLVWLAAFMPNWRKPRDQVRAMSTSGRRDEGQIALSSMPHSKGLLTGWLNEYFDMLACLVQQTVVAFLDKSV
jgi:hypothetical protein